ncbi:30S ribosomal protein S20 [bacterium]|jgi:small subunit ribosomal protein S20|nr:30S ribosomal protein S20 [bacterium]MBT3903773.1 30S ribosomal protein S20 [bacterium]MBT4577512.1 30S ribosomal protein S20 [bacterium]MBT5345438.1 30S ribosomal protein S20 [bacterium]MBT6131132.1 30S ribosomal protein S20 [bacterium]
MANSKSSKKRARQAVVRRLRNNARRSSLKSAVKKVIDAVERKAKKDEALVLLRDAESQFSRAKGKGVLHRNTASRRVGRLAKRINAECV